MVRRHIETFHDPIYSVAGLPEMVKAIRQMLSDAGVSEDQIGTEAFAGY